MLTTTFTNRGIMKIYIDDIEVASFDKYSSIAKYNVTKTKTGINISTTGLKTLKIKCVGQNISSSGYYMHFQSITLWRTE